jgi:NAD(P)-dependent dehydrogenase (short-subunit alcohol dehydrogenase family)
MAAILRMWSVLPLVAAASGRQPGGMSTYTGKRAVVLGGTHGMGLAVVERLRAGGAEVLSTGRSASPQDPDAVRADVTRPGEIDALGATIAERFGEFDLLHVNVGVATVQPFEEVTPEIYDRMFDVNTRGAFFAGFTTMSVYSGTKAAVRAFAKVLAAEFLPRRIRVNTVAPGFIDTPTMGFTDATAEERAAVMKVGDEVTPMRRHGTVDEVARAVLFLGFDATFTTGVELPVDGGLGHVEA